MHSDFANWYRAASFGHNREIYELRWQGVETALNQIDVPMAFELVRLVFGRELVSPEVENTFRQFFKASDTSFLTAGNDLEVKVLAGCVLAMTCIENKPVSPFSTMAILTTAAFGLRELKVEIDLVGMAANWVLSEGGRARKRNRAQELKPIKKTKYDAAITPLVQANGFPETISALKSIAAETISQFNILQEAMTKQQALLEIQDEELQILWWVVGGRSDVWDSTFTDLKEKARPILLAIEAAAMTSGFSEPPSLGAIFSQVGVNESEKVTIQDCINACGIDHLKSLAPSGTVCPTIFPIHFAMSRSLEAGATSKWVSLWSRVSGINAKAKITPVELAIQVHRERQLMNHMESRQ